MRWCPVCETWYHLGCLKEKKKVRNYFNTFRYLEHAPSDNWYLWDNANNARTSRTPRTDGLYHATPFTIEMILDKIKFARSQHPPTADVELPNFKDFVLGVMRDRGIEMEHGTQLYEEVLEIVSHAPDEMMYECGNTACEEWI